MTPIRSLSTAARATRCAAAILLFSAAVATADPKTAVPAFDPAAFSGHPIDHPYLSFLPGAAWHYTSNTPDGTETTDVEVSGATRMVAGVLATVVRDQVRLDGALVEDTFDWYAQDRDGNVWYLGEDTKSYDANGNLLGTTGSWEAGIDGTAGIAMLATPERGDVYAQENATGIAEDMAKVTALGSPVVVPYGAFSDVIETLEWTPLEPGARERKFYARGVGLVLETGKKERVELTSATLP